MANIYRLADDENRQNYDAPGSRQLWQVTDQEDPATVATLVLATVAAFDEWGNPFIEARPKHMGAGVWNVEVEYGPIPPLNTGLTIWEWDIMGQREKRYQTLKTRYVQQSQTWLNAGQGAVDFNGAINVSERGPEGVEVYFPKMAMTGKRKYNISGTPQIPSNYLSILESLTATVNAVAYTITSWGQVVSFAAGEMLFLGAVVNVATMKQLEIDHRFEVSRDRINTEGTGVSLSDFAEPVSKPGWDYAWISYRQGTTGINRIPIPQQYQSEKVYPDGDHTQFVL